MSLLEQMTELAKQSRAASRELAKLTTAEKNTALLAMAEALEKNADALKKANALDMETGAKLGQVAQPLRAALTGSTVSPGIDATLAALGRAESLARIAAASEL